MDPRFRNDHQLLFELELAAGVVRRITLHPVFIDDCRTLPANADQRAWTFRTMTGLCTELGTPVRQSGDRLLVEPAAPWRGGTFS